MKQKTKGILLIACGHTFYGKMAAALAASLRHSNKTIPICLAYAGDALGDLRQNEKDLFTEMIPIPEEMYKTTDGKIAWIRTKLFAYDLSPFDKTLYLDVDMMWMFKNVELLFNSLEDVPFTMISEGYIEANQQSNFVNDYSFWADIKDIREAYGRGNEKFMAGRLYQLRSELMYFIKSGDNKKYFDTAKKIYDNPKVIVKKFAGHVPDEFAFDVASCMLHHYPHADHYCPIFWEFFHSKFRLTEQNIYNDFFGFSIGGNITRASAKEMYNRFAIYFYKQLGLSFPFFLKDNKSTFLPERKANAN